VYLVLLAAAVVIVGGVVVVAMGRGGEMTLFRRDLPDVRFRLRTPEDVAALRLPVRPLGFSEHATSAALLAVARMLADRDAEIAMLHREVRRLSMLDASGLAEAPDLQAPQMAVGDGGSSGQPFPPT
jgi:hypothetical protein